mmetsp:Transcript_40035/g.95613  ORF Transcript_40035/g.95613 Transcript_40035/m.95613 type:complete len:183 (-) Transcript_40035:87-635(-)
MAEMTEATPSTGGSLSARVPPISEGKPGRPSSATSCPEEGLPSRSIEEHRCDPALRQALQRLDAVRRTQPKPDDFGLERFLTEDTARPRASVAGAGLHACFSTDLLLAAVRAPRRAGPLTGTVVSRSTSPGSTLESSTSGSLGGFSSSGEGRGVRGAGRGRGYEAPQVPPGVPPRRPRRRQA